MINLSTSLPLNPFFSRIRPHEQRPGKNIKWENIKFGGLPGEIAKIPCEHIGGAIHHMLETTRMTHLNFNGLFNLSLEDWSSRFITAFGIYLPQGITTVRQKKRIWETNIRNLLSWCSTLVIAILLKNNKFSVNSLIFNHMMKDSRYPRFQENYHPVSKSDLPKLTVWDHMLKPFRMKGVGLGEKYYPADYFHILKNAGIPVSAKDRNSAFWAKLDLNQLHALTAKLEIRRQNLLQIAKSGELEALERKIIPQFIRRVNIFSFASTAIITAITAYIVGKLIIDILFKFVAPLDKAAELNPDKSGMGKSNMNKNGGEKNTHASSFAGVLRTDALLPFRSAWQHRLNNFNPPVHADAPKLDKLTQGEVFA